MSPARSPSVEGTGSFCLNCDNQHGCRGEPPPCQGLERADAEQKLRGKALMKLRGALTCCARCACVRQCWTAEAYRRALAGQERDR